MTPAQRLKLYREALDLARRNGMPEDHPRIVALKKKIAARTDDPRKHNDLFGVVDEWNP